MTGQLKETIASAENEISLKYTDHANHLKICIRLVMQLLAGIFKWSGFNERANKKVLTKVLTPFAGDADPADVSAMATAAIEFFSSHEPLIIDLKTALHTFHLIEALSRFVSTPNNHQYSGMLFV